VDSMIESRIVLEKIKPLEAKLRYQIEKLVRVAEAPESVSNVIDGTPLYHSRVVIEILTTTPLTDPLAFRPNPKNLMQVNGQDEHSDTDHLGPTNDNDTTTHEGIYRPPRVAPVPYTESSKSKSKSRDARAPRTLATLALSDPSKPHIESTSGLGSTPSLLSGRANYLKRLNEFEEENFTRVIMKKSDARRRLRDEADLALGGDLGDGAGSGKGKGRRARAGGLEDEFGDVLKSVGRGGGGIVGGRGVGDGYDELRQRGKKADVLERSRRSDGVRKRLGGDDEEADEATGRSKKRTRFELDAKAAKKRLSRRKKSSS
jgi:U3 small nucleolar ribonucleoprotein protein LCP5